MVDSESHCPPYQIVVALANFLLYNWSSLRPRYKVQNSVDLLLLLEPADTLETFDIIEELLKQHYVDSSSNNELYKLAEKALEDVYSGHGKIEDSGIKSAYISSDEDLAGEFSEAFGDDFSVQVNESTYDDDMFDSSVKTTSSTGSVFNDWEREHLADLAEFKVG